MPFDTNLKFYLRTFFDLFKLFLSIYSEDKKNLKKRSFVLRKEVKSKAYTLSMKGGETMKKLDLTQEIIFMNDAIQILVKQASKSNLQITLLAAQQIKKQAEKMIEKIIDNETLMDERGVRLMAKCARCGQYLRSTWQISEKDGKAICPDCKRAENDAADLE
ncbi:MAG: hypothetical protein HY754_09155 [Nitrospirae bacterium]|nr:hypothetical protein [Nitrospirota bacterium]